MVAGTSPELMLRNTAVKIALRRRVVHHRIAALIEASVAVAAAPVRLVDVDLGIRDASIQGEACLLRVVETHK